MEYASRGDLYDYICDKQHISEQEARQFFRQIVSAVHYCHQVRFLLTKCFCTEHIRFFTESRINVKTVSWYMCILKYYIKTNIVLMLNVYWQ